MKSIGPVNALYPMPTVLVGATVNAKPNFLAVAHVGILNMGQPQYLSVGLSKAHYTNAGIRENKTYSICLPGESLMKETDYCGIMTGRNTDKSALFEVFYGQVKTAPLIGQCPVNMALTLHDVLELGDHEIFIGKLEETFVDEAVMTGDSIDADKVKPMLFDMGGKEYRSLGRVLGACWSVGKELKKK